jgi:hypothetical protein
MKRHRTDRVERLSGWCALALVALCGQSAGQITHRTVALTGQQAANLPAGVVYSDFFSSNQAAPVRLNRLGHVAFVARVTGPGVTASNDGGMWVDRGGVVELVAREGEQAPLLPPGVVLADVQISTSGLVLNSAGDVVFKATVAGPGVTTSNDRAAWMVRSGVTELVLREGDPAPEAGPDEVVRAFILPAFNSDGVVGLSGGLSGPGVVDTNDEAVWSGEPGGLHMVLRESEAAPGFWDGVWVFSVSQPAMNEMGALAFRGSVEGPGIVHGMNDPAIWAVREGAIELLAGAAVDAPGAPPGTGPIALGTPLLNEQGLCAFEGDLFGAGVTYDDASAVWSERGGVLAMVVRGSDPAPDTEPGVVFSTFDVVGFNGFGEAMIHAYVRGPGVTQNNDRGFWSQGRGELALVLREGQQAPEQASGVLVFTLGSAALNRHGQHAVSASMSNNASCLWVSDATGSLRTIVRTGQVVDVDDDPVAEDLRTVNGFAFGGLNDAGEVLYRMRFTDGGSGVFVATLPAPGPCPADINGDDVVDAQDFVILAGNFGGEVGPFVDGDLDGDGWVLANDFAVLAGGFGCGLPEE